jgi:K+/H+ antiporter YhaU regulatory subunit KhtT
VFLPKGAWVVGRTLADCKLERFGIAVHSLRRGARILAKPAPDMVFEAEDIVVLAGEQSGLERAESVLLGGG